MTSRKSPSSCERIQARRSADKVGSIRSASAAILDAIAERGVAGDGRGITRAGSWAARSRPTERDWPMGTLIHATASELMAWVVGNAKVEPKGNASHHQTGKRNRENRSL